MTMPGADSPASDQRRSFLRVQWVTLAAALPAMVLVLVWWGGWREAIGLATACLPQVAAGYAAMIGLALWFARRGAGDPAASPSGFGHVQVGMFLVGVMAACVANWLGNDAGDPHSYFVKPCIALLTFGCVPAFLLGWGVAWLHRRFVAD